MAETLTRRPFSELRPPKPEVTVIRRRTTDPESGLKLVRQIRATPLSTDPPHNARLTPDPTEPEPVAKKSKRSPESIAKQKATIAAKKRKVVSRKVTVATGDKAAFIRANPSVNASELVKLGKKQGIKFTASYVYNVRTLVKKEAEKSARPNGSAPVRANKPNGASSEKSLGDLLEMISDAALEIKRRLSQLTI